MQLLVSAIAFFYQEPSSIYIKCFRSSGDSDGISNSFIENEIISNVPKLSYDKRKSKRGKCAKYPDLADIRFNNKVNHPNSKLIT